MAHTAVVVQSIDSAPKLRWREAGVLLPPRLDPSNIPGNMILLEQYFTYLLQAMDKMEESIVSDVLDVVLRLFIQCATCYKQDRELASLKGIEEATTYIQQKQQQRATNVLAAVASSKEVDLQDTGRDKSAEGDAKVTVWIRERSMRQHLSKLEQDPMKLCQEVNRIINKNNKEDEDDIRVVAAKLLPSEDLELHFDDPQPARKFLARSSTMLRGLGCRATIMLAAYGVVVGGVRKSTVNLASQHKAATIAEILATNHNRLSQATITWIGWLNEGGPGDKERSSLVIDFTRPEDANAVLDNGLIWRGENLGAKMFDCLGRITQCARCSRYGHIARHCCNRPRCAMCSGFHDRSICPNPSKLRCVLCHEAHPFYSRACAVRQREQANANERLAIGRTRFPDMTSASYQTEGPEGEGIFGVGALGIIPSWVKESNQIDLPAVSVRHQQIEMTAEEREADMVVQMFIGRVPRINTANSRQDGGTHHSFEARRNETGQAEGYEDTQPLLKAGSISSRTSISLRRKLVKEELKLRSAQLKHCRLQEMILQQEEKLEKTCRMVAAGISMQYDNRSQLSVGNTDIHSISSSCATSESASIARRATNKAVGQRRSDDALRKSREREVYRKRRGSEYEASTSKRTRLDAAQEMDKRQMVRSWMQSTDVC